MKKILIISYHFIPEIAPRAFRAFELARELSREYQVDVVAPTNFNNQGYQFNFIRIPAGLKQTINELTKTDIQPTAGKSSWLKNLARKILHFVVPGGMSSFFAYSVVKNRNKFDVRYDAVISIALPIAPHIGAYFLKRFYNITDNLILDYGDPFSSNPKSGWSPLNRLVDKLAMDSASAIAVPVKNAIPAFENLIDRKKIHVIPQGVNIEDLQLSKYEKNQVPTCAYAGLFYKDIRDPDIFFKNILSLDANFKFLILTDMNVPDNRTLVEKYQSYDRRGRLQIIQSLPRNECIKILSAADFLVNVQNKSSTQNPSKLIDYSIAHRPILGIDGSTIDTRNFERFLKADYTQAQSGINITDYDIRTVAKQFSKLIEKEN